MNNSTNEAYVGTTPVRAAYRLDEAALEAWMRGNVAGFAGPLSIEQFKGGQSNPTYKLMTPNARYVLRRKPSGPLVGNAHDVVREARVLQALGQAEFPVPAVYAVCAD